MKAKSVGDHSSFRTCIILIIDVQTRMVYDSTVVLNTT